MVTKNVTGSSDLCYYISNTLRKQNIFQIGGAQAHGGFWPDMALVFSSLKLFTGANEME